MADHRDKLRDEAWAVLEPVWTSHVGSDLTLFEKLVVRHREKQRKYHTADHVAAVVGHLDTLATGQSLADAGVVYVAALYHDAIYEPISSANERASARLARRDLTAVGWDESRIHCVSSIIEGTAAHADPPDLDTATLFDADLAILGASPERYAVYARQIRSEYHHVSEADWQTGRATMLRSLVDRPSIFATATGRDMWESRSRSNIAAELAALTH